MKQPGGGKALLFENVTLMNGETSAFPVAINTFGSMKRMSMSLGVNELDEVGARITELLEMKVPEGLIGKLSLLPKLLEVGKFPPRMRRGDAPCQEIVWRGDEANLDKLPLLKCWPGDGGAYLTFPMVITRDPRFNVGVRIMHPGRHYHALAAPRSARPTGARWPSAASGRCAALEADPPCIPRPRRFPRRPSRRISRRRCR